MVARTGYYPRTSTTMLVAMAAAALVAVLVVSYDRPASARSTTPAAAVGGTVIEVTTVGDESNTDGDCSLREAIQAADANAAVDGCKAGSASEDAIHFALGK